MKVGGKCLSMISIYLLPDYNLFDKGLYVMVKVLEIEAFRNSE